MPDIYVYINKEQGNVKQNEIGIVERKRKDVTAVRFINSDKVVEVDNSFLIEFTPAKTGDAFNKKICNICNRLLPIDNFQKNQNGINNRTVRRPSCNDCRKVIDGQNMSSKDKKEWEKRKPHMTSWVCPICKKRTIPGLTSKVVLDHDHKTGKPRAWICDSCNTGLGRFKDDITIMENAIEYLKSFEEG